MQYLRLTNLPVRLNKLSIATLEKYVNSRIHCSKCIFQELRSTRLRQKLLEEGGWRIGVTQDPPNQRTGHI